MVPMELKLTRGHRLLRYPYGQRCQRIPQKKFIHSNPPQLMAILLKNSLLLPRRFQGNPVSSIHPQNSRGLASSNLQCLLPLQKLPLRQKLPPLLLLLLHHLHKHPSPPPLAFKPALDHPLEDKMLLKNPLRQFTIHSLLLNHRNQKFNSLSQPYRIFRR